MLRALLLTKKKALKTYKNTELPIRLVDLNLNYSFSNIDFKSNTAFEYNWSSNPNIKIDIREYYLSYYPDFGEINIGKQIINYLLYRRLQHF